jgi:pSer/pThr/pTyr-binding forkhead associated (FHA) protein
LLVVAIGRLEIGRSGAGLLLADPEISRRHLMVESVGDAIVVSDLGSTNGTTVDGVRITVPRVLGPGHVLRFGHCTLELWSVGGHPIRTWSELGVSGRTAPGSQVTYRGEGG